MLTQKTLVEGQMVLAGLAAAKKMRAEAESICSGQAFGKPGAGLSIKLSDPIVATVKRMRLAEVDLLEADYRRRAAQISLVLE